MPNETPVTVPVAAGSPSAKPATQAVKPAAASAEPGKVVQSDDKSGRQARLADLVKKAEDKKTAEKSGAKGADAGDKSASAGAALDQGDDKSAKPSKSEGYATKRIVELETENTKLKSESRESFIAEAKKDYRVLLRALGSDADEVLLAMAEARGKEQDPEERVRYEVERQTAGLRRENEEAKQKEREAADRANRDGVLNATRAVFKDGFKEGEEQIVDPTKFKLSAKLTAAGIIDAPAEAMSVVGAMVKNARDKATKEGKAAPVYSDKQAATMLAVAFEAIEKREQSRKSAYADEPAGEVKDDKAKIEEDVKTRRNVRRTLTSRVGYGQTIGREETKDQPKNRHERRSERLSKIK